MEKSPIKRIKPIPSFQANEGIKFDDFDLNEYIKNPADEPTQFTVELADGGSLPKGLICSEEGVFGGTPEKGTARDLPYELLFIAQSENADLLVLSTTLKILPGVEEEKAEADDIEEEVGEEVSEEDIEKRKKGKTIEKFWKSFTEGKSFDLEEILTRDISPMDVYYLLGRFGTLTIWNSDDLSPAAKGYLIELDDSSSHYLVFDFKVALVATPKDLFDYDRTIDASLKTARAMTREIHKRAWNIEMAGFDKMVTAAWVEVQHLNRLGEGHKIEIHHYEPSAADYEVLLHQTNLEERSNT